MVASSASPRSTLSSKTPPSPLGCTPSPPAAPKNNPPSPHRRHSSSHKSPRLAAAAAPGGFGGVGGGSGSSSSPHAAALLAAAAAAGGGGGGHLRFRRHRLPARVLLHQTRTAIARHARRIATKADEHEHFINKLTYSIGVIAFGLFCFLLGSRPHDVPFIYALFFTIAIPLRWVYYRTKKWHYFLLDFCYYANVILLAYLFFYPRNAKLFLLCFAFSEGPLAWALIVWRCSLVFSSLDKIVSVLIHLLPGTVVFIIRWWDPVTFQQHQLDETGPFPAWPLVEGGSKGMWLWMYLVPLAAYSLWQALYWLIVHFMRHERLLKDPEVMTSFRELSRKASRANNVWWRISGCLGDGNRFVMYALLQALFTVATMALTVPMFNNYHLHAAFQVFKVAATVWNGGNFFFDVMPRQVSAKAEHKRKHEDVSHAKPSTGQNGMVFNGVSMTNGDEQVHVAGKHEEKSFMNTKGRCGNSSGSLPLEDEVEEVWEEVVEETLLTTEAS